MILVFDEDVFKQITEKLSPHNSHVVSISETEADADVDLDGAFNIEITCEDCDETVAVLPAGNNRVLTYENEIQIAVYGSSNVVNISLEDTDNAVVLEDYDLA